ncbi:MAG: DUF2905 domain-containing protein [Firmicutes bacterium]|nr:DUF2905 domain-containing protein [Bacillota bacterium]
MFQIMGKYLIIFGIIFVIIGVFLFVGGRIGLGKLPGDIIVRKKNFVFYFPLITCIIISIILTLIFNLIPRFRK